MVSLFVVALFFLMILTPCFFALRTRFESAEPAEDLMEPLTAEPTDDLREESFAAEAVSLPGGASAAAGGLAALEAEVLAARRSVAVAESELLAAEARLAMARARQAADHAALASRAAAQAVEAAAVAQRGAQPESRVAKAQTPAYDGPVVDGSSLPETHPSMDFPRSRVSRRAA